MVQYRVERKERKDRKRRGRRWRQRKGGILEIKSGGERESRKRIEEERKLKVSVRTVWSLRVGQRHSRSHLCANQPFGWLMRCQLVVCVWKEKTSPFAFLAANCRGWWGGVTMCVYMCATLECKQADVLLVVPVLRFFFFFSCFLPSPSPLFFFLHIMLR